MMLKMDLVRHMATLTILAGTLALCPAATKILLTNGNTFVGDIISETPEQIVLSVNGNAITIFKTIISKREEVQATEPAATATGTSPATAPAQDPSVSPPVAAPTPAPAAAAVEAAPAPVQPASAPTPVKPWKTSFFLKFSSENSPDFTYDYKSNSGTNQSTYDLEVMVGTGIRPKKLLEFRPAIGLLHNTRDYQRDTSGTVLTSSKDHYSEWGLAYELGFYFHLPENEFCGFSLGPDLYINHYFAPEDKLGTTETTYKSYYDITIALGIPLNLDIKVNRVFAFRMIMDFITYNAHIMYWKDDNNTIEKSSLDMNFDILTHWTPTLGIVVMF
jgi:hypothetical protein